MLVLKIVMRESLGMRNFLLTAQTTSKSLLSGRYSMAETWPTL